MLPSSVRVVAAAVAEVSWGPPVAAAAVSVAPVAFGPPALSFSVPLPVVEPELLRPRRQPLQQWQPPLPLLLHASPPHASLVLRVPPAFCVLLPADVEHSVCMNLGQCVQKRFRTLILVNWPVCEGILLVFFSPPPPSASPLTFAELLLVLVYPLPPFFCAVPLHALVAFLMLPPEIYNRVRVIFIITKGEVYVDATIRQTDLLKGNDGKEMTDRKLGFALVWSLTCFCRASSSSSKRFCSSSCRALRASSSLFLSSSSRLALTSASRLSSSNCYWTIITFLKTPWANKQCERSTVPVFNIGCFHL